MARKSQARASDPARSRERRVSARLGSPAAVSHAFRAMLDSLEEGVMAEATDGTIVFVNAMAERLLSVEPGALLGRTTADWTAFAEDGSELPFEQRPAAVALRTGEPQLAVVVGLDLRGGERRWLQVSARAMDGPDVPWNWAVTSSFVDVTPLRETEQELRESEQRFRALAHNAPVGIFLVDEEAHPVYWNRRMGDLFGGMLGDHPDKNYIEVVHPDDRELLAAAWARTVASKKPFLQEYRLVLPDGIRWVRAKAAAIPSHVGLKGFAGSVEDITDERVAVSHLAANASEFRLLADNSTDVISRHGLDEGYPFLYASPASKAVFGRAPSTLLGRSLAEFVPETDYQRLREVFHRAIDSSGPETVSFRFRRDGRECWLESTLRARSSPDGSSSEVQVTSRDVTDRVAAEHERQSAEERFRRSFYDAPVGMILVSPGGRVVQVNRTLCEMTGHAEHELLGADLRSLTHADDAATLDAVLTRLLAGEATIHQLRKRWLRADGDVLWVEVGLSLLRAEGTEPLYFVGQVVDVSARVRAEETVRERDARLQALVDHTPSAIYLKDLEGRYILVNQASCDLAGVPPEEMLGRTDDDLFTRESAARLRDVDRRVLEHGPLEVDEIFEVTEGHRLTALSVKFPLVDAEGAPYAIGGVSTDVTDRLAAEAEHADLETRLRQAQRLESVGRLAAGIAHDFNNLLAVIENSARFVATELPPGSPLLEDLQEVRTAASRAGALTHRLLVFSRQGDVLPETLDLSAIISAVEELLRRTIGEDIDVSSSLETDLWLVEADRSQMEQIILNLVINARDAMPGGGALTIQTANVELSSEDVRGHPGAQAGDFVSLSVTDTGVGMDAETSEHAFEPFFTTKEDGSGLGLATTWGIASRAGGFVTIDSALGAGTAMRVLLPRAQRPARVKTPAPAPAREPEPGEGTILVVEDDEPVRRSIVRILTAAGYEVLEAPRGNAAIELARGHDGPIRLLVSDVMMPGLSGMDLHEALQATHPGVAVVYVSGSPDAAAATGADGEEPLLVAKPFTQESLLATVTQALRDAT